MNNSIRVWIFSAICIGSINALFGNQEQFIAAHALYDAQQYQKALDGYDAIADKTSAVWYNMGNCAFQLEQYDLAVLYWRKAERGAPAELQKHIIRNMQHAAQHIADLHHKQPHAIAHHQLKQWLLPFSLLFWQLIFLVLWALFMLACAYYMYRARGLVLAMLFGVVGVSGVLLYHRHTYAAHQYAITLQATDLFVGPNKEYHALTQIPSGSEVRLLEHREGWHKVRYRDLVGWVFADTLAEV